MRAFVRAFAYAPVLAVILGGLAATHAMTTEQPTFPINAPLPASVGEEWASDFGMQFQQGSPPASVISGSAAVDSAFSAFPDFLSPTLAPEAQVEGVHYGVLTASHYYTTLKDGTVVYPIKDREVWIVTISHAQVPLSVPRGVTAAPVLDNEAAVIVDAYSGQALEMFNTAVR
jgi:hypothetical protein